MNENVRNKLNEIWGLVLDINTRTKHHAFLRLSPHVQQIEVNFYTNGWAKGEELETIRVYYDLEEYELDSIIYELDSIIKNLSEWSGLYE